MDVSYVTIGGDDIPENNGDRIQGMTSLSPNLTNETKNDEDYILPQPKLQKESVEVPIVPALQRGGLLGLIERKNIFFSVVTVLLVIAIVMVLSGTVAVVNPGAIFFGEYGNYVGIPLVVFGLLFIVLTWHATWEYTTLRHITPSTSQMGSTNLFETFDLL